LGDMVGAAAESPGSNVAGQELRTFLKTFRDGGCAGLSSGLIRRRSRASAEDRARPQLQVTDHADLPRTHVHRLGKRVGGNTCVLSGKPDSICVQRRLRPPAHRLVHRARCSHYPSACNWRATSPLSPIRALTGPDAVPTGLGTGITAYDTRMVTISGEQPDVQARPQPGRITPQAAGTYRDD
jgi:hypothetical protein